MRYINLLDTTSRVKTTKCFTYNNIIFFAVPRMMVSQAIGPAATNVRRLQEKLGKRIRIIEEPHGASDINKFIIEIVEPVKFKSAEVVGNELVISSGGSQNKAMLFGRNKHRFEELQQIVKDVFGLELKIV
jgi:transcription antitermination factor NusA-like protein